MTEAEWLSCRTWEPLIRHLRLTASDRKMRLFACGCCRLIEPLIPDELSQNALAAAEEFADSRIPAAELKRRGHAAFLAQYKGDRRAANMRARSAVVQATYKAWSAVQAAKNASDAIGYQARATDAGTLSRDYDKGRRAQLAHDALQADLGRCVFGNPFRPVTVDPSWLGWNEGTVAKLAQVSYDHRAFDRLPILADALEEAGCTNTDILDHLRGPGPHVRGCWVIDLLLGKT